MVHNLGWRMVELKAAEWVGSLGGYWAAVLAGKMVSMMAELMEVLMVVK